VCLGLDTMQQRIYFPGMLLYVAHLVFLSGVVTLIKEHPVCKIGDTLTPEQARILVSVTLPCPHLADNDK